MNFPLSLRQRIRMSDFLFLISAAFFIPAVRGA